MANVSRGVTFAIAHKVHYSLENFCSDSCQAIMYCTQQVIHGGILLQLAMKTAKVFPFKTFAVYGIPNMNLNTNEILKYLKN